MMENKFVQNLKVSCYETDASQLLKPVSFLNYAQEIANRHAEVLGFGFDDMMRTRTVWVLSRIHVKFLRHPRWRENLDLVTWHKGLERIFYLRDFRLEDETGNPAVLATTSWLVVNMDTRHLVRNAALDESTACQENALGESCGKVRIPADLTAVPAAVHRIAYSDLDFNGHTNNAMYLEWAMDAVGLDVVLARPLKELKINFSHETLAGQEISLWKAFRQEEEGLRFWIEGKMTDKETGEQLSAFCTELLF